MKTIVINIERSDDLFCAWATKVPGVTGAGTTAFAAKSSLLKSIQLLKKYNKAQVPSILLGDYQLKYKFDMESFLQYYKPIFTHASMERLSGINQKQLQHYASGLKKPRTLQKKKIEMTLHLLGKELLSVSF
jgi:hypothetical protein